jgi:hypothetical protein
LVAGADSSERKQWAPFVAAFAEDGRERFRILLHESAPSSTKPPRAAAVAIARTQSGSVYVLSTAAQTGSPTSVTLTLLEADGRQRFSVPIDLFGQVPPALHADSQGHAIVVGIREPGALLGILKFADDGTLRWSKNYRYEGDVPRLAEVGDRLLLAGSFHGSVEFGDVAASHTATLFVSCGTEEARCEAKGKALVVAELDAAGDAVRARMFGAPAASITLSGVAARPEGRSVLTGEFQGPNVVLGSVSLCEREPGMPPADATGFREREGAFYACSCREGGRDLFALELGADLMPRWAKILATGRPQPRIAWSAAAGGLVWAAHTSRSTGENGGELSLWEVDSDGRVTSRRSAPGPFSELAVAEDRIAYLSDRKRLMRAKLAKRMP